MQALFEIEYLPVLSSNTLLLCQTFFLTSKLSLANVTGSAAKNAPMQNIYKNFLVDVIPILKPIDSDQRLHFLRLDPTRVMLSVNEMVCLHGNTGLSEA